MRRHNLALLSLALFSLTATVAAQEYEWQNLENQHVRLQVSKKLAQVPMQIGAISPKEANVVAKFEPQNDGDYIWGRYGRFSWDLLVMEFAGSKAEPATPNTGENGKPMSKAEAEEAARKDAVARLRSRTFVDWVKDPRNSDTKRRYIVEGKENKGSSKKLGYTWWEYTESQAMHNGYGEQFEQVWYTSAAAYPLPDGREIGLVVSIPVKGDKPDQKWVQIVKRMLTSLEYVEPDPDADDTDAARDKFAVTEKQKESLKVLKDNIRNLDNWDYFTTPDFIITYSWSKPEQKKEMRKFARWTSEKLEDARTMFRDRYPPHDAMTTNYSIIRVCSNYDEFRKYGDTPYGVVGWFSPGSKELVIYYDKQHEMVNNEDQMLSIAYHEAWHQYSDQYWPGVDLHRWFDEGLAEYFGALRVKGKSEEYTPHRGRLAEFQPLLNSKAYVPTSEIVIWDKPTFYGANASAHYAQAWVMMDFLMRGKERLGSKFDDKWSQIVPTYGKVALETKSEKKAVEAAFAGVDMAAFEAAWIDWFKGGNIKRK